MIEISNNEPIIIGVLIIVYIIVEIYFSPIRLVNKYIKLRDLSKEEVEIFCNYFIEILSQEYDLENPRFEITNLKDEEINYVKYNNNKVLGFFSGGDHVKISIQLNVIVEENLSFTKMVNLIAHEFQHYLDYMSFNTNAQWELAYSANVKYYEFKANIFASKKVKRLVKKFLNEVLE